jgi:hypothetical protein
MFFPRRVVEWGQIWIAYWFKGCKNNRLSCNLIKWKRKCSRRRIVVVKWHNKFHTLEKIQYTMSKLPKIENALQGTRCHLH